VTPVADTPSITNATTAEDTMSASGLVITRHPSDGAEVTHFKILSVSGGTLYQSDGVTPISAPTFITAAQGGAGLRFAPAANSIVTGQVTVQASIGAVDAGLGGSPVTADITITPVADAPLVTPASTLEDTQTTSGLVISRNAADSGEVTHFTITAITNGTLFQQDGTTPIGNGAFITIAQGAAGLTFTPATDSVVTGHVTIQASIGATDAGLGGSPVTADIVVTPLPSTTTVVTSGTPTNPGEAVTFTATVTPSQAAASGTVQFMNDGTALGSPVPLSGGTASFTTSTLSPGLHAISAVYSGNTLALASTGVLAGGQLVRTPVTVSITSSGNPTDVGSPVTISAAAVAGGGTPTGTMTFKEGPAILAVSPMSAGAASFTTSTFTIGTHHLTVDYSGDAAFGPGTGTFDQIISCPVMTLGPDAIAAAVLGVPYTQTFTQSGGVGTIVFSQTGALPAGLSFTAATATLSGTPLAPGSYPITVTATPANGCGAVSKDYTLLVGGGRTVLTGADAGGGPHVRRFSALDGSTPLTGALNSFFAFDPSFAGGVRVATGDINGDGEPDYITAKGPGTIPEVRVFDGATGTLLWSFMPYEIEFRGGVFVAAGDVDGDGFADVITGSGAGRSGEVKVFSGRDGSVLRDMFVFARAFTGGISVAAGDVNGDGRADLVVGSGPGMPAQVRVLNANDGSTLRAFMPYGVFFGGVWVAAGDVTGDGFADIVTGAGAGGGPHVLVVNGVTGAVALGFFAFDPAFTGGARVAAGDVNGDGRADVIVGSGAGRTSAVRVFDGATAAMVSETEPYGPYSAGVFVATAVPQHRMAVNPPAPAAVIHGPFTVAGWAFVDPSTTAGIAAIHVWAVPVTPAVPTFLGLATLGDTRPDVAALYGAQYVHAGFHLDAAALPPGDYYIAVFAQGSVTGTFQIVRVARVTITP
jgi:hypothetical protein